MIKEPYIAAGAEDDSGSSESGGQIRQRAGEREDKLPAALVGDFLTLRIGVGKQAADGQKQYGAEAQAQPRCHEEARCFAHSDSRDQQRKRASAGPSV